MHHSISAGAPPQTLLGELTALPQTPHILDFRGPIFLREGEGEGRGRKGRGRKGRGGRDPQKVG